MKKLKTIFGTILIAIPQNEFYKKSKYLVLIFIFIFCAISCEQKYAGKTRSEWQEYANQTGRPVHLPEGTVYPEGMKKKKKKKSENSIENDNIEPSNNTSNDNNETDEQVDAATNTVIEMLISAKRECKCCVSQFSPRIGYNSEGQSPTLGGSDWCPSGQTEYCSEKCYNKFASGNCE